jgi:rRNA maturation RNase YbeY
MAIVVNGARRAGIAAALVRNMAEVALGVVGKRRAEASVNFVDDRAIARLNATYRRKRGATDVLAFSADGGGADLGDIFISPAAARRKARARGSAYRPYLALLVVHGILHLAGYDHTKQREASTMEKKERRILNDLDS